MLAMFVLVGMWIPAIAKVPVPETLEFAGKTYLSTRKSIRQHTYEYALKTDGKPRADDFVWLIFGPGENKAIAGTPRILELTYPRLRDGSPFQTFAADGKLAPWQMGTDVENVYWDFTATNDKKAGTHMMCYIEKSPQGIVTILRGAPIPVQATLESARARPGHDEEVAALRSLHPTFGFGK